MKVLVFKNGITKEVTGESGKYWLCGEERFRKLGHSFSELRDIPDAEKAAESPAAAPVKKAARKKKKSEVSKNGERGE